MIMEKNDDNNQPIKRKKRLNILNPFGNVYKVAKSDEEKKKKTVIFGWLSILFSLLCVGLVYPCVWLGVKGIIFTFTTFMGFFTYFFALGHIIIFSLSLCAFLIPFYLWIHGVVLVIWQLCLNRRFIGWLALIIWLASVVGMIWLFSISMDLIINPLLNS